MGVAHKIGTVDVLRGTNSGNREIWQSMGDSKRCRTTKRWADNFWTIQKLEKKIRMTESVSVNLYNHCISGGGR